MMQRKDDIDGEQQHAEGAGAVVHGCPPGAGHPAGARVEIYRNFGPERTVFYEGVSDASGIVEDIRLPALPAGWSQSAETAGISDTTYQVSVRHPQYGTVEGRPVTVFPRIETILAVSLESA